jgi:hypothetical protein
MLHVLFFVVAGGLLIKAEAVEKPAFGALRCFFFFCLGACLFFIFELRPF